MADKQTALPLGIGIIGDYNPDLPYHRITQEAIAHGADALELSVHATWIPTRSLAHEKRSGRLETFDGLWCAPGDYQSMDGALAGICFARQHNIPFMGTCGGFQHALLEFARNVLGLADAAHEEITPHAPTLFITRLACSLAGKTQTVRITPETRTHEAYRTPDATEHFVCNFGLNPHFRQQVLASRLKVAGIDAQGEIRIVELADHPFFVATLYQPQMSSKPGNPHPLITAFLKAAQHRSKTQKRD